MSELSNSEFWYLALKKIIENEKKEEQRKLLKEITEADEKDGLYDESFNEIRILISTKDNGDIYWKGKLIDSDIHAVHWIRQQLNK